MRRVLALLVLVLSAQTALAGAGKGRQKRFGPTSAGNDVTVVEGATDEAIASIDVAPHPHGIAVPAAQNLVLISIERAKQGELVYLTPAQDKIYRRMNIGPAPNAQAITPD